ncbi:proteasome subunit beta type-6-like [Lycium barbarum]|uniref:proteasome subunit beta type-6-like n=1 Tax=Lycium barbarum TaxID=112863 RepID=UPI00293F6FC1|nr:proteasome subunit beta type-6-like [Lycium barbarum]
MCLFIVDSDETHPSNTNTIIGITYNDGVILGSTDIITQLSANIFSCQHALEAQTEILLEDAHNFIFDQESTMVVAETIGTMLAAYNNKNNMLQTGLIIGDRNKIFEISYGGVVMQKSNFAVGGYGVTYLNDFLEKEWKKGMNEEEAEKLVLKALSIGGTSSRGVQTASANSKGVTRVFHPNDTLPIRQEALELKHVNERAHLECIRAHLISLLKINEGF